MPSRSETTRHEAPDARSAATCLASTAVRGRPSRFPFDWASRSAASPALPRHPEPNPCLRPQHSPLGRRAAVEDAPRTQECRRAQPRSTNAVTAHLIDRPNWPGLPLEAGLRTAAASPIRTRPVYPLVVQATASLVLMLNIAAAGVAPRRAGRLAREPPKGQPADAAKLRSPHAVRLEKRIKTGKLVPRQACPKYARVFRLLVDQPSASTSACAGTGIAVSWASSLSMASLISLWATMAYLSNTDRVRHPPIFMMTPSATPARRRLRAAVRRSGRASQEALIRAGGYAEIGLLYTALAAS
jgi:hypothetical protein